MEKVIIIGSGPAGLTAAIYLARAQLSPLVIGGLEFGGQLMTTTEVDNFPGFDEGITGPELVQKMVKQAKRFSAQLLYKNVTKVDLTHGRPFKVWVGETLYESEGVIVATGAKAKSLGLPSEKKLWGRGVSTCATCDGPFYKDKVVAVIGGGDTAMEESHFLSRFAQKVYVVHRRDTFRATPLLVERLLDNEKIEPIYNATVSEILGTEKVTGIRLENAATKTVSDLPTDGVFLAIGYDPVAQIFKDQLTIDAKGYLVVRDHTRSNIEGVFIAGDVADDRYRQAVTAAAEGCKAALDIQKWLSEQE